MSWEWEQLTALVGLFPRGVWGSYDSSVPIRGHADRDARG